MSKDDFIEAKIILSNILLGDIDFKDKMDLTTKLQLLDLTENECMRLYEHIDRCNTEYNILCFTCRNSCAKSEQR